MTQNKRRFSRVLFNVRVRLEVDDQTFTVDRLVNLSIGGCLLEIDGNYPPSTPCKVVILLDRMAPGVAILGEILRCDDSSMAIKFTSIDPEALFHLQNIIRYNAEDPDRIEQEISERPGLK